MQPEKTPNLPNAIVPTPASPGSAPRRDWKVSFVVAAPQSMPSDRLKARAELVRSALSSSTY